MPNELTWLGHASWQLTTSQGKVILFDPWLSGNPAAPMQLDDLPPADYVLLTHDHFDHAGDLVKVVAQTGATVVCQFDTAQRYMKEGLAEEKVVNGLGLNLGGTVRLDGISVTMVDAYHSSDTGSPGGFVVALEDGQVLYNAGDTCLHVNMRLWGELFKVDVAILPIDGYFTMDGLQAARALEMLGQPAHALPQHYKTFPVLAQDAEEFIKHARQHAPKTQIHAIEPGERFSF